MPVRSRAAVPGRRWRVSVRSMVVSEIESDADDGSVHRLFRGECAIGHRVFNLEVEQAIAGDKAEMRRRFPVQVEAAAEVHVGADAETAAFEGRVQFQLVADVVVPPETDQRIPEARLPFELT